MKIFKWYWLFLEFFAYADLRGSSEQIIFPFYKVKYALFRFGVVRYFWIRACFAIAIESIKLFALICSYKTLQYR